MTRRSINFKDMLLKILKAPDEAEGYLKAALEMGDPKVFDRALQYVLEAHGIKPRVIDTATSERTTARKLADYQDRLLEMLKDPKEAIAYLNAALNDKDPEVFIIALQDVCDAQQTSIRRELS